MRIGISTSVIQRGKTGIAQYLFGLLRAFLPYAEQHTFKLFVLEEDLPLFKCVEGKLECIPVPEHYRPPAKNIIWHQTSLPKLAKTNQLDVLHVPSYRRLLWRQPCPLVATIHDLAPFHITGKYDWKRTFYARVIVRRLARRQHQIIAISENTARDIRSYFRLNGERITVVYNGIDHDRFFPGSRPEAQAAIARRFGLCQPFFLYIARLEHPAKNHVRLISAFEQFKAAQPSPWELVFAGSDWHGAAIIHDAVRKSPVASSIRALGFVPDELLPDLYRAAECFIYPSLYEGFGLPPVEAMACGCPVICSTRGSLAEVVQDAAATIDPEQIESMAAQMRVLANDEGTRSRLRSAGLGQAQKFHWTHCAARTLEVYERAVL